MPAPPTNGPPGTTPTAAPEPSPQGAVPPAPAPRPASAPLAFPLQVACIDLGSNGIRLAAAQFTAPRTATPLLQDRAPVRLGQAVFATGAIDEATLEAAAAAVKGFAQQVARFPGMRLRAVATSAVRDARNRKALLRRVRDEAGLELELVSGTEEARLVHLAVSQRLALGDQPWLLCDVGGGSVEVSVGTGRGLEWTESYPLGGVRLLQAFGPAGSEVAKGRRRADRLIEEAVGAMRLPSAPKGLGGMAATGGNIEELAEILRRQGDAAKPKPGRAGGDGWAGLAQEVDVVRVKDLRKLVAEMQRVDVEERAKAWDLKRDRADVIVPAGLVYLHVAEWAGVDTIHVPHVALKDGVLADLVADAGAGTGKPGPVERRPLESALALGRRFRFEEAHGAHVAKLALQLFDQLGGLHGLAERDRAVLAAAAMLHDVGRYVADKKHHKHSYYLVSQSDIAGLDRREVELAAQVARYHRKAEPKPSHTAFAALRLEERRRVERMAALLRVADALDRQHRGVVGAVTCMLGRGTVTLMVDGSGDLELERWAVEHKGGLFERLLRVRLDLVDTKGAAAPAAVAPAGRPVVRPASSTPAQHAPGAAP